MVVPRHYIVPLERFNRQLGNTVGINVAEFEFPAYYNFFFHRQSVNLIVDSKEVSSNPVPMTLAIDTDPNPQMSRLLSRPSA